MVEDIYFSAKIQANQIDFHLDFALYDRQKHLLTSINLFLSSFGASRDRHQHNTPLLILVYQKMEVLQKACKNSKSRDNSISLPPQKMHKIILPKIEQSSQTLLPPSKSSMSFSRHSKYSQPSGHDQQYEQIKRQIFHFLPSVRISYSQVMIRRFLALGKENESPSKGNQSTEKSRKKLSPIVNN